MTGNWCGTMAAEISSKKHTPWDRDLLLDILTDAVGWSCAQGYWGQVEKWGYDWPADITDETVLARVRDDEDGMAEAENRPFVDITLPVLQAAVSRAWIEYPHLWGAYQIENGKITDMDYDALSADVALQFAVLGEAVYG